MGDDDWLEAAYEDRNGSEVELEDNEEQDERPKPGLPDLWYTVDCGMFGVKRLCTYCFHKWYVLRPVDARTPRKDNDGKTCDECGV